MPAQRQVLGRLRRACDRSTREEGAYAILFALLVVVLVGVVGFALDTALLRESRASTRSMADAAVVAAGSQLKSGTNAWTPRAACNAGWSYLAGPLGANGSSSCDGFPVSATTCPATASTATWSNTEWRVVWTWPVLQTSTLMTTPDSEREQSQVYNATVDGASPCDRIAVEIFKVNQLGLSSVFGGGTTTTRSASVARSTTTGSAASAPAALNVLNPSACNALYLDGGTLVQVGTATRAGYIAVESNGRLTGGGSDACGANRWTIAVPNNSRLEALGGGAIYTYALQPSPTGSPVNAYQPNGGPISPTPTVLPSVVRTTPVTSIYDCSSGCEPGGGPYVTNLRNDLGTAANGVSLPTVLPTTSANAGGSFQVLGTPASTVAAFRSCSITTDVVVPAGNWFVACPGTSGSTGLRVSGAGRLIFQGGIVVTAGQVRVGAGACLAVNVSASAAQCTAPPAGTLRSANAILYLRAGDFASSSGGYVTLHRTFTYLANGAISLNSSGGAVSMSPPLPISGCAASSACAYRDFWRLTLWSSDYAAPQTSPQFIGGGSNLRLSGVLYTPTSFFNFAGGGSSAQQSAQFWADRLNISGNGSLVMDVDPSLAVSRPVYGSVLIR